MENAKKNVALLAGCQAMLFTNNVTLISLAALAGFSLAENKALATLPATAYVIGAALTTLPASFFMRRFGRQTGFRTGTAMGILGASISCVALSLHSFWLLCFATLVLGAYNAFGQFYRFAAADAATHDFKAKAISLVMTGGIVGGIVGPELSKHTKDLLPVPFLGAYASLIVFCLITLLLLAFIRIPKPTEAERREPGRPLGVVMAQPAFMVAVLGSAIGYGVMNLLMTATPLAMDSCGLSFADTAVVLQWHVIAMFAPSFFTGQLIRRFGVARVLLTGAALMFVCVAIALSGVSLPHFWWALLLLGAGWNFLFIGGTTLLTETYRPEEKAKVQGGNDFIVLAVQAATSLGSGALIAGTGWTAINQFALPLIALTALATLTLRLTRRDDR